MIHVNQPLTKEAARKLMALDLTAKELTTYEKLDEWYTAWGGQCYVSFSGGKDSTVLAYLAARETEYTNIRILLMGRAAGLSPEIIRSRLRRINA